MTRKSIRVQLINEATLPQYMSAGCSGADLFANIKESLALAAGERALVPTGLCIEVPKGIDCQIRPRSGLALQHGITCLNSPATIDSDFRGEIQVLLINLGQKLFTLQPGSRIAQLVFSQVIKANFICVQELDQTHRGKGGFGSTGV